MGDLRRFVRPSGNDPVGAPARRVSPAREAPESPEAVPPSGKVVHNKGQQLLSIPSHVSCAPGVGDALLEPSLVEAPDHIGQLMSAVR